jgi:hypothetical protein
MNQKLVSLGALVGFLTCVFSAGCGGISARSSIQVAITNPASPQTLEIGQAVNIGASVTSINGSNINSSVTWSLSAGAGCTGQACGSLTNQTTNSVTYNAPASQSGVRVLVTATSVENPSLSASISITVAAITVSIQPSVNELAAGTGQNFSAMFTAAVQNDPTSSGVTWSLKANGVACSPGCGTLSIPIPYEADYTPPPTVPAAPANTPTITATSVTDSTKSATDTFTIFDGATACKMGGNESVLNGQYAIMLQGWSASGAGTPILFGASFGADGTGKITGGQDQFNPYFSQSYAGAGLIPSASSYSVGPDNRGCLTLTDQFESTSTLYFSVGGITNGIASKGDVIFFNQQSSTTERASGILRRQDPTAFSLSALAPSFVLGVDGWGSSGGSSGALTHFALAGSFSQSGGALSNLADDANSGGEVYSQGYINLGTFGTMQPVATSTGLAYATLNLFLPAPFAGPLNVEVYVINSSELFFISLDLGAAFSGRAIAAPASFSSSSVLPSYIFRFTGNSSGAAATAIGLAGFSGGLSGAVTGSMDQYSGGTASQQNLTGTYGFTPSFGRLAVVGASSDTSPICYLTGPLDGVSAFCISADSTASLGVLDAQPAATYGNSSLAGNLFFFGSMEPGDATITDLSGVASISSGSLTGTEDESALGGLSLASAFSALLTINANGSGNLGANTVAVTNGLVLYFIDEADGAPAQVQVFEK